MYSMQQKSEEEPGNEARKKQLQCSPQLIHLQYQRCLTQRSLHGDGRHCSLSVYNHESYLSLTPVGFTTMVVMEKAEPRSLGMAMGQG